MPALFIASPGPGEGKTAIALGLAQGWQGRGKKLGYIRLGPSPEGDVSFAQRLGLEAASCPPAEVEQAFNRLAQGRDLVLIEGLVPEVEAALKKLPGRALLVLPFKGVERAGEAAGRLGEALAGAVLSMVPRSRMEKAKKELVPALKGRNVAVLVVEQDTPTTLERLEALLGGVRFRQEKKLPILSRLLQENLDLKALEKS